MASCLLCESEDMERRVHIAAMDDYHEHFATEHRRLRQEYNRLEQLLEDVVWYNFETVARTWKRPWPESIANSQLKLQSQCYSVVPSRGGRHCERAEFPIYYHGPVSDAPRLPPMIVFQEVKVAYDAMKQAEENCAAPYEWAPGGRLYEKLLRESEGVRAFNQLSSKADTEESNVGRRKAFTDGFGLLLGDRLEREAEENTETTAKDILGRVCGDRSLVRP